ncbi:MAG: DUF3784 domain-containing protein [Fermentimonas sp.]
MDLLNLIVGLIMISIGFLVKSTPNLIAGYNAMSKEKKKNVDIEGLTTFLRNGFITIGLSIIIGYYLLKWIGFTMIANSMILIATLVGVTIMVIKARKFDHDKTKNSKMAYFILGLVFLFVIGLITYGFIPSKTIYGDNTIKFSGMYGFEIGIGEIEHVELSDKLPTITSRSNGFSFGNIKKGFFNLDEFGKNRLLIHSDLAPYLIMTKNSGDKIIINFKDKIETEETYNKIKIMINK